MSLTVAAGPIAMAVSCESPALGAALRRRYGLFMAAAQPQLTVEVAFGDPGDRAEDVAVEGTITRLVAPHMDARIDLAAHRASLVAAPGFAEQAVELVLRVACALLAFDGGGVFIHGAAIISGGRAHLFLGPSGAGKTTTARNAAGRRVLNDDLIVLSPAGGWRAHATPFTNPSQVQPFGPGSAPLAAIHYLVQAPLAASVPIGPAAAVAALIAQVPIIAVDPARAPALLQRARAICGIVSSDYLHLRADPSFWQIVDQAP